MGKTQQFGEREKPRKDRDFPRITVHNHSKTQLTRMNDCCALFIIGISLARVAFKKSPSTGEPENAVDASDKAEC